MKQKIISMALALAVLFTLLPAVVLAEEAPEGIGGFQEVILLLPEGYSRATSPAAVPEGGYAMAAYHQETGGWALLTYLGIGQEPAVLPLAFDGNAISMIDYAADGQLMAFYDGTPVMPMQTGGRQDGAFSERAAAPEDGPMLNEKPEPQQGQAAASEGTERRVMTFGGGDMVGAVYWFDGAGNVVSTCAIPGGIQLQAAALSGRRVAVSGMELACAVYGEDGKELARFEERAFFHLCASGDRIYLLSSEGVLELDGQTLAQVRKLALPLGDSPKGIPGKDGTLWVVTQSGLYTLAQGEDRLALQYEMNGTLLSDPELEVARGICLPDGSFVMSLGQSSGSGNLRRVQIGGEDSNTLAAYVYSADLGQENQQAFTITALRDSALLRKAVLDFQRAHPELRVKLNTLLSADDSAPVDDAVRTLNTQLLAGQGGDVLILDELPMEKYIQKGLLMDLTEVLSGIAFLPGIREGSQAADGKLYAMPAQFSFETLWGPAQVTQGIQTMEDFLNLPLASGQTAIYPRTPEDLLRLFFPVYQPALEAGQSQFTFETPAFEAFLETLYSLYASQGDLPAENQTENSRSMVGASPEELQSIMNGASLLLPTDVVSMMDIPISYSLSGAKESGFVPMPTTDGRATYEPSLLAGINAQSGSQELAAEFLRLLYSQEIQEMEQTDGLPTLSGALDKQVADMIEMGKGNAVAMISFGSGNPIQLQQPDEDTLNRLRALCDTLIQPISTDEVLMQFLVEETADFFAGSISASDAARALQQRAWAYLNE